MKGLLNMEGKKYGNLRRQLLAVQQLMNSLKQVFLVKVNLMLRKIKNADLAWFNKLAC